MMDRNDGDSGLICAYVLDGQGGGTQVELDEANRRAAAGEVVWFHFDRSAADTHRWLRESSGVPEDMVDALLAEETRPRIAAFGTGILALLRGVNLNPGADPHDMISVRIWIEPRRVITLRKFQTMAISDVRERISRGIGPRTVGEFIVEFAERLIDRMDPVIATIDDELVELEDAIAGGQRADARSELTRLRRQAITLRRYLAPQREALVRLAGDGANLFDDARRLALREVTDRLIRYVEDLEEMRDRALVLQDELANRLAESMNRTMYLLTIVATIMLPLGFLTGLLGINVGGIPGAESQYGFFAVCAVLVAVVVVQVLVFRHKKWL
jgi:zinc transporter